MTFVTGFIVGFVATNAIAMFIILIYAAVLYGRRVEAERAQEPTVYDEVA